MSADPASVGLSIVVPAHNSGTVIEGTLHHLAASFIGTGAEIIAVENGSRDDTFVRCRRVADEWRTANVDISVLQSERGMGNALRAGVMASRGAFVLLTADDLPFGLDDLYGANRLAAASGGHLPPVVIGSKAHPDSRVDRGELRALLTTGFGILRRLTLGMRTGDPQGTILMDGDLIRRLAPDTAEPGFLFTTELIFIAECMGIRPAEVPVRLSARHRDHQSRIAVSDVLRMGLGLLRLRVRHRGAWPPDQANFTAARQWNPLPPEPL
jgi:glycosyltransferase involved in cell wall biosynthesis